MILNTTYHNKDNNLIIKDIVGKSFSFIESLKMKGIGSKRMIVNEASSNLQPYLSNKSGINYASIELRKKGILLYINKGLQNFTWAIPYYQLVIFKTDSLSIHAQGKYIKFKNNNMLKANKSFLKKIFDEKIKYESLLNFQNS